MRVDGEFRETVARLMADSPPQPDEWVRDQAVRFGALPLGWDLWSYWFLQPEGRVVITDGEEFEIAEDRSRVLIALAFGRERYPELAALLPPPDPDAFECPDCAGTGRFPGPVFCHSCGALGWRPRDDD